MDFMQKISKVCDEFDAALLRLIQTFYEAAGPDSGLSQDDFLAAMAGVIIRRGIICQALASDIDPATQREICRKVMAVIGTYSPGTTVEVPRSEKLSA